MAANRKSLCGRHRPFHRLTAVMWFRWVHSRAKQMRMHWRRRSAPGSLKEMVSGRSALDLIKASWKLGKALSMLPRGAIRRPIYCLMTGYDVPRISIERLNEDFPVDRKSVV